MGTSRLLRASFKVTIVYEVVPSEIFLYPGFVYYIVISNK